MKKTDKKIIFIMLISAIMFIASLAIADYPTNQKIDFITSVRALATNLQAQKANSDYLYEVYFDRGYNSGGADEIVAGDLVGTEFEGMPISVLTDVITAINQYKNYFDNSAVTTGDYGSSYRKITK